MNKILFTADAIDDLQDIKKYIEEEFCSKQSAKNIILKITNRIVQLEFYPESGTPLNSIISIENNFRFLVCGNYIIFYCYENDEVHIVRILYRKRNFIQILFNKNKY
ncbi:MAG: type II toxin-antitoxin system RelE/ParE family toxin [Candidatus Caccosoma sp.]|nr:type II toxin-antitoxin system RelE/ParE family toxin [Candidatus Caccosoma sp.]